MANAIYNFFFNLLDHEALSSAPSAYFNNGWNAIKQLFNAFFSSR
ncbi:hypothetical protein [Corynebacterium ulcerans]|uniref:Uncharacterized protein n=1 Tax=Corynebacterium ulcerans TaxID=65058 RepID=A0ABD7MX78_CORUL|nr:hypothetical protein [Corynebacterium ulcerans]AEG82404.1 hypothetical protein CULC809_01877 [Corynebacterium ulcerans 809]AIT89915.1 Hypothetical protein Cul210932_2004 [Corynebacterium ulcerans]ALD95710.1 Hypothetical protein Cul131001_2036 [Corynebacterium ulcerans]SNV07751.1 Uncharacterised protein [Corynebacterium ulcerans]SQG53454.1 Uncharacterised protein [Corynebacterium ulcerans]